MGVPDVTVSATSFIDSPFLWVLLMSVAVLAASLLVRVVPVIRASLAAVESNRRVSIDGLRGFLGLSVFIHHAAITWFFLQGRAWGPPPSRAIVHAGQTSLALFFMITAFLFWGRMLERRDRMDWAGFITARLFRLYPVYLVMLALIVTATFVTAAVHRTHGPVAVPLIGWLTMFGTGDMNGVPRTTLMVAGVTWSLRYEWLFYLALPLLGLVFARTRQPLAAGLSVAAILAVIFVLHARYSAGIALSFAGGIAAAYYVRRPRLVQAAAGTAPALAALAALLAVIVLLPTAYTWQATLGLTVFFTVVASGNDLWGLLRRPGLLWLGDITYSIYLLHGFVLWVVFQAWLPGIAGQPGLFLGLVVLIDIAIVAVATLTFLAVERPGILLGRHVYRRLGQRAAPAATPR